MNRSKENNNSQKENPCCTHRPLGRLQLLGGTRRYTVSVRSLTQGSALAPSESPLTTEEIEIKGNNYVQGYLQKKAFDASIRVELTITNSYINWDKTEQFDVKDDCHAEQLMTFLGCLIPAVCYNCTCQEPVKRKVNEAFTCIMIMLSYADRHNRQVP